MKINRIMLLVLAFGTPLLDIQAHGGGGGGGGRGGGGGARMGGGHMGASRGMGARTGGYHGGYRGGSHYAGSRVSAASFGSRAHARGPQRAGGRANTRNRSGQGRAGQGRAGQRGQRFSRSQRPAAPGKTGRVSQRNARQASHKINPNNRGKHTHGWNHQHSFFNNRGWGGYGWNWWWAYSPWLFWSLFPFAFFSNYGYYPPAYYDYGDEFGEYPSPDVYDQYYNNPSAAVAAAEEQDQDAGSDYDSDPDLPAYEKENRNPQVEQPAGRKYTLPGINTPVERKINPTPHLPAGSKTTGMAKLSNFEPAVAQVK